MQCRTTLERFSCFTVSSLILSVATVLAATASLGAEKAAQQKGGSFALRYAETFAKLAALEVHEAQQANKLHPGTVRASIVEELRENLHSAMQMVKAAREGGERYAFEVHLRFAKVVAQRAEHEFQEAKRIQSGTVGKVVSKFTLRGLQLRAELTKINLDEGVSLRDAPSEKQNLWKLRFLCDEVFRLNEAARR